MQKAVSHNKHKVTSSDHTVQLYVITPGFCTWVTLGNKKESSQL